MNSRRRSVRRHGRPPYSVVVVHGGPGAPGSAAEIARDLSRSWGVLEPWQSARTVNGQVEELAHQVEQGAVPPVVLIGHSWGAWLSLLFAARHPEKVRRIVLVGCPPFYARDARAIRRTRRTRLRPAEWKEFRALERELSSPGARALPTMLRRLGELSEVADSFELIPREASPTRVDPIVFRKVWNEAAELRSTGALLRRVREVSAPILVVHGEDDPHPAKGVVDPLRRLGLSVHVVLLGRCGHEPWRERHGRGPFYRALRRELSQL